MQQIASSLKMFVSVFHSLNNYFGSDTIYFIGLIVVVLITCIISLFENALKAADSAAVKRLVASYHPNFCLFGTKLESSKKIISSFVLM